MNCITLSVVSHAQADLVKGLLRTIDETGSGAFLEEVIITNNIAEESSYYLESAPVRLITNDKPKGFGDNHNYAFKNSRGKYFCVVNPDIRLKSNPFPYLLEAIKNPSTGLVAPLTVRSDNSLQDSLCYFPSVWQIIKKLLGYKDYRYPIKSEVEPFEVDWAAGMFHFYDSKVFKLIGGFDDKFFLYYEDVDICMRLWLADIRILACPRAIVIHDAQRSSHKKLRFLLWHIGSLFRYFKKYRLGPRANQHL